VSIENERFVEISIGKSSCTSNHKRVRRTPAMCTADDPQELLFTGPPSRRQAYQAGQWQAALEIV
jgi:hypothetical protein